MHPLKMSEGCAPKQEDWKCSPQGRAPERSFPFNSPAPQPAHFQKPFVFRGVGATGFLEGGGGDSASLSGMDDWEGQVTIFVL